MYRIACAIAAALTASIPLASLAQDVNSVPLQVVDANGKVLGRFLPGVSYTEAFIDDMAVYQTAKGPVAIPLTALDQTSWTWSGDQSNNSVVFASANCTGIAYFTYQAQRGLWPSAVTGSPQGSSHHYLYLADSTTPAKVSPTSTARSGTSGNGCFQNTNTAGDNVVYSATDAPLDLATLFTPPFRLR